VSSADERAEIFIQHRTALVNFALPIVGDRARAEDVVQEAFLRFAPSNGSAAHPIKEPLFYLYRIVRNLAYDVMRKRATEAKYSQDYSRSSFWLVPQEPRTPEDDFFLREDIERIDAILETVPARAREAVKMHRIAGYTLEEVAEQLDVSINTAHRLVREALVEIAVALASTDA
jgi:RNA polymerase sigma-70 factor (ECF subfamily)